MRSYWTPTFSWCCPPPVKKNVVSNWTFARSWMSWVVLLFVGTFW